MDLLCRLYAPRRALFSPRLPRSSRVIYAPPGVKNAPSHSWTRRYLPAPPMPTCYGHAYMPVDVGRCQHMYGGSPFCARRQTRVRGTLRAPRCLLGGCEYYGQTAFRGCTCSTARCHHHHRTTAYGVVCTARPATFYHSTYLRLLATGPSLVMMNGCSGFGCRHDSFSGRAHLRARFCRFKTAFPTRGWRLRGGGAPCLPQLARLDTPVPQLPLFGEHGT